ncbi:MAG: magnesium transporter MgtE N-terminal domain-containing protein, partial [Thiohalomonadales bacterium]
MPTDSAQAKSVQLFSDLLVANNIERLQFKLSKLHAAEIAHVLESLPQDQRDQLWQIVDPEKEGDV